MLSSEGCPDADSQLRAGVALRSGAWRVASACARAGGVGTPPCSRGKGRAAAAGCNLLGLISRNSWALQCEG